MIDALGAIFNMLVAAVSESRSGHGSDPPTQPWQKALSYGEEACNFLENARDKLIAEATGLAPGEDLGPVIMPEAIVITLLERLIQGVYGSGTVDVINVFEECLEQLVGKNFPQMRMGVHSNRLLMLKSVHPVASLNESMLFKKKWISWTASYFSNTKF